MSDCFFFKDDELIHKAKVKPWSKPKLVFQDKFELAYSNVETQELHESELSALVGSTMLYDVECYSNFFFVGFRHHDSGKVMRFELSERSKLNVGKLQWVLENFCIVGYNSLAYDILMVRLALTGATCKQLHNASGRIIYDGLRSYDFEKGYKLPPRKYDHIDLIEVAPLRGSLKLYAGRLHTRRMQDLPVDPNKPLTIEEMDRTIAYCFNDLDNTGLMVNELAEPLQLRVQMSNEYNVDLRSKSDAQIAEVVISHELERKSGKRCKRPTIDAGEAFYYRIPEFISYRSQALKDMLAVVRKAQFVVSDSGKIEMPPEIADLLLNVGKCTYKMGIGGLHSTESCAAHLADDNTILLDRDVVSYYPSIILNQRLFPQHLGRAFLEVYRSIVERRITAKRRAAEIGEKILPPLLKHPQPSPVERELIKKLQAEMKVCKSTADSLKICINGSFGKLGSKWSVLYAPDLMIQVTITGQLALLMLIEMVEDLGIEVVSGNTDGIAIKCPHERYSELIERVRWWEQITGFETEEERYKALYARDVNNYLALKQDGKWKVKGTYAERGSAGNSVLSKNPENLICNDAVMALIAKGTPVEDTIRNCKDIRRFVTLRNVTGGARKSDTYLAKVIRWYYSTEMQGEINRATKGDKVPNSDRARPLMELPDELPQDIDYERYIVAAYEILYDIGHTERPAKSGHSGPIGLLFA